jgi:hypothetical protein
MVHSFTQNPFFYFLSFHNPQNKKLKKKSNLNSIFFKYFLKLAGTHKESEVLWRTGWGTKWELGERIGNLMGTWWV